jgi:hypothetical protein
LPRFVLPTFGPLFSLEPKLLSMSASSRPNTSGLPLADKSFHNCSHDAVAVPLLEVAMADLLRRIMIGNVGHGATIRTTQRIPFMTIR